MQNPTEISSFPQTHLANLIEEHSRARIFHGRYLLQFSTFSGRFSQLLYLVYSCGNPRGLTLRKLCVVRYTWSLHWEARSLWTRIVYA
ncbi:hypothetical protein HanIR_Chr07g0316781 [Helianthus annuus]|nr:hypothetical protein HanIR_Chr07g0316781 [Helianthus annuus]